MGIVLYLKERERMVSRLCTVRNITPNFWFGLDYPEHVIHTGTGVECHL